MNFADALNMYLALNLMLAAAWILLSLIQWLPLTARDHLKLHYTVLSGVLIFAIFQPWIPRPDFFTPPLKVWAQPARELESSLNIRHKVPGRIGTESTIGIPAHQASDAALLFLLLSVSMGLVLMGRDQWRLNQILRTCVTLRKFGPVQIWVSPSISMAFSHWRFGRSLVVLPEHVLFNEKAFRLTLKHELQHHRQGDTRWLYVIWALRWICPLNPAVYGWSRLISDAQEFACDEALIDRGVELRAYGRCLVEAAQQAMECRANPIGAIGFAFADQRQLLKRRIEYMVTNKAFRKQKTLATLAISCALVAAVGAGAWASSGLIKDRRISLNQAQALAAKAQEGTEFPIVVNEFVLKWLNHFLGTPQGRKQMSAALTRLETYRNLVAGHIERQDVPTELMAIPIIESGYRNLDQSYNVNKAAGLWQFIPSTAKNYGLTVNDVIDERLHESKATDAALRYLKANYLLFNDWHAAVFAYNSGERFLLEQMAEMGTRDVWTLIRSGREGDKGYLPKAIAAMIIMKNPETLK